MATEFFRAALGTCAAFGLGGMLAVQGRAQVDGDIDPVTGICITCRTKCKDCKGCDWCVDCVWSWMGG